jgi:hypothetical protein
MTTKHTPGPWASRNGRIYQADRENLTIANIARAFDGDYSEANARLIAAAPDLLSVLKELQASAAYWSEYDVPLGIVERINAAVTKAEGGAA